MLSRTRRAHLRRSFAPEAELGHVMNLRHRGTKEFDDGLDFGKTVNLMAVAAPDPKYEDLDLIQAYAVLSSPVPKVPA